jgi:hypothetical protein
MTFLFKPTGSKAEEESVTVHATTRRRQVLQEIGDDCLERVNIFWEEVKIRSSRAADFRVKLDVSLPKYKPMRDRGKPFTVYSKPFTVYGDPYTG